MEAETIQFGLEALRSAALINGGAAVAGLTLVGAIFETDRALAISIAQGVVFFAIGTALAGLAAGFSYVTQFSYASSAGAVRHSFNHLYVHEAVGAAKWSRIGVGFHWLAVLTFAESYGALIWGALRIYHSIA